MFTYMYLKICTQNKNKNKKFLNFKIEDQLILVWNWKILQCGVSVVKRVEVATTCQHATITPTICGPHMHAPTTHAHTPPHTHQPHTRTPTRTHQPHTHTHNNVLYTVYSWCRSYTQLYIHTALQHTKQSYTTQYILVYWMLGWVNLSECKLYSVW